MLRAFERRRLLRRRGSEGDGRSDLLSLTPQGRRAFAPLEARARAQVGAMLRELPGEAQDRLVGSMRWIESALGGGPAAGAPYLLRPHQPGDLGWGVERHRAPYSSEYGWDEQFEGLVGAVGGRVPG